MKGADAWRTDSPPFGNMTVERWRYGRVYVTQNKGVPASTLSEAAANHQARIIGTAIAQRCARDETTTRYGRIYQAAMWGAAEALRVVPDDVSRLVIAARALAFGGVSIEGLRELDSASEAFAARVPWDDEPPSTPDEMGDAQ